MSKLQEMIDAGVVTFFGPDRFIMWGDNPHLMSESEVDGLI